MARYADDAVIGCEQQEDADRIMKVVALRFETNGVTLHPEKTRLRDFTRPTGESRQGKGSFTVLGLCHYWVKSRKGRWMAGRKTDSKRLSRAVPASAQWCRENRHRKKREQQQELAAKLRGRYA